MARKYKTLSKEGKIIVFGGNRKILIFCNEIERCKAGACKLYMHYLNKGYDVACVNPSIYGLSKENLERIFKYADGDYEDEEEYEEAEF